MCFLPVESSPVSPCAFSAAIYFLSEVRAVTCSGLFPSSSNSSKQCSSKAQWWDAGGVFVAGESSGWKEVMLSGVRLTATLSEAQPVEQQMCPFHSANPFFLRLPCLLGHIPSPKPPFHFKTSHSLHPVGKPWPPGLQPGLKWAALISGSGLQPCSGGRLLRLLCAGLGDSRAGRQQARGAASNSLGCGVSWTCASCAWDLHYVLTCKYWFIPVSELPYQMMPDHAEMSGSFAM